MQYNFSDIMIQIAYSQIAQNLTEMNCTFVNFPSQMCILLKLIWLLIWTILDKT